MSLRNHRRRLGSEDGFTMLVGLIVMTVSLLMIAAAFVAARGDINNSQHDLEGKRAFYAARAGLNNFVYKLNKNTELWQTCPSQATTNVPGSPSGGTLKYAYVPLPANGKPACSASDPVHTMIDLATGSFRMQFTGTSGTPAVSRTIVASFRRDSPLDFLWYSKYETLDPNTYDDPAAHQSCATFRRDGRNSNLCGDISWITGDTINGPMYTQDQYSICGSPVFGRANGTDTISTAATSNALVTTSGCSNNATLRGDPANPRVNAPFIDPPPDNSNLLTYAQQDGAVFSGQTTITLSGTTATVVNRPTSAAATTTSVNLVTDPIIYVTNGTCAATYSPYNVTYPAFSGCGNVYVSGSYSTPVTIAAANDIIVTGSITTATSGSAVMGLVANNFIRIQHGVTQRCGLSTQGSCPASRGECGGATNQTSSPDYTHNAIEVDAAVLALNHSFIVDNYDCGAPITGNLTVVGAIAQLFRGTVGTTSNGNSVTGYLKNYNYDDRLAVQQPPYLFDLASSSWRVVRETSCTPGSSVPAIAC